MARKTIGGAITSMPHNDNYTELYDIKADKTDVVALEAELDDLAGIGRTTETVKKNTDDISNLNTQFTEYRQLIDQQIDDLHKFRIHKGDAAPTDTIFWLDTSV